MSDNGGKVPLNAASSKIPPVEMDAHKGTMTVTPLEHAVSPFDFMAAVLEHPDWRFEADQIEHHRTQIRFLRILAERIDWKHKQPIILLAVGRMALFHEDRLAIGKVMHGIDKVIAELQQ